MTGLDPHQAPEPPRLGVTAETIPGLPPEPLPIDAFRRDRGNSIVARCWQVILNNPKDAETPLLVLVTADTAITAIERAARIEQLEIQDIMNVGARLLGLVYI